MALRNRFRTAGRNLFRKPATERELEEEVRAYVEMLAHEKIQAGMNPAEAHRQALIDFGGIEQVKEQVRDVKSGNFIASLFQDLRFAVRTLMRSPAFAAAALLSLAIGIGCNVAMFSLVNGIFLRPLPYSQPDRLVRVSGFYPKGALAGLARLSKTVDVAGFTTDSEFNVSSYGQTLHVAGSSVSVGLFHVLGVRPVAGRTFLDGEDQAGHDRVVILSYKLWQHQFGGDRDLLGSRITIDGLSRRVIGVMAADFRFPDGGTQLWIPLHLDPLNQEDHWGTGFMPLVARLRSGVTIEEAQDEIRPLIAHLIPLFPYTMARQWNADATVVPLQQNLVAKAGRMLPILICAVATVLLIACANVANLLLSSRCNALEGNCAPCVAGRAPRAYCPPVTDGKCSARSGWRSTWTCPCLCGCVGVQVRTAAGHTAPGRRQPRRIGAAVCYRSHPANGTRLWSCSRLECAAVAYLGIDQVREMSAAPPESRFGVRS